MYIFQLQSNRTKCILIPGINGLIKTEEACKNNSRISLRCLISNSFFHRCSSHPFLASSTTLSLINPDNEIPSQANSESEIREELGEEKKTDLIKTSDREDEQKGSVDRGVEGVKL